jgi:cell division protein FtsB
MPRSSSRPAAEAPHDTPDARAPEPGAATPTPAAAAALGSLSDLPVAGLTRRRIALLIGSLVAAWVIVLFARQVGDASEATARADGMRAANVSLQGEVAALQGELQLIGRQAYIEQQAREYRLGTPREIPFVLADDAAPLAADAPGTAAVRLGAVADRSSPLESWLELLFGPGGDPVAIPGSTSGS